MTMVNALRARMPRADDDRGTIAFLLLAIIVGVAIGSLLLAMVITQDRTTRFNSSRLRALDAAQGGIDVMLGQIRQATGTDTSGTYGDDNQLPCGTLTGLANSTGTATYSVSAGYYLSDPATGAAAMRCAPGYGPFDPATGSHTPRFAKITSFGVQPSTAGSTSTGRTLTTTYALQTDDRNVAGGQFRLYGSTGAGLCMDAGTAQPAIGALVEVQTCSTSTPVAAQQVLAYRSDLSIQLVSSATAISPLGLCLDSSTATHQAGSQIVLNPCNALGTAAWNQQWSADDTHHLHGAASGTPSPGLDNWSITAAPSAGQALTLANDDGSKTSTSQTWVLAFSAGVGGAGATNNMIVNYQNAATCIDVTGEDPSTPYLILYGCKQNPNPSAVSWNQKFAPALGPLSRTALPQTTKLTTNNGAAYCMQSPTQSGGYVTLTKNCTTTWIWNQTKDSTGASLPYAKLYTIVDSAGRCLSPGPSTDLFNGSYLKLIVTACDGGTEQKWNADPGALAARLLNTTEK